MPNKQTEIILQLIDSLKDYSLDIFLEDIATVRKRSTLVSIKRAAEIAKVSERTIMRWLAEGIVRKYKMPGTNLVAINRGDLRLHVEH